VVNQKEFTVEIEPGEMLSDVLRYRLGLTGTKISCNEDECGACTVLIEGLPILSCNYPALKAQGKHITTIEGLASGGELHPMQAAFKEHHGLQCGFCTPGMVMSAVDLLQTNPDPSEKEVRDWLEGNICRCTGYHNIVKAVLDAAAQMRGGQQAAE
jgi:carbon-monoxide dehydrogenase small subunit